MDDRKFEIYLIEVAFEDSTGTKKRPIVLISYVHENFYFQALPVFSDRPKFATNNFYQDFMYEITDYQFAGLDKKSWINVKYVLNVPVFGLKHSTQIGKLSDKDAKRLMSLFAKYWKL